MSKDLHTRYREASKIGLRLAQATGVFVGLSIILLFYQFARAQGVLP